MLCHGCPVLSHHGQAQSCIPQCQWYASCKRRAIFHTLRQSNFEFCLLQKTHSTEEVGVLWQAEWGGEIVYNHGASNARGVAILVKRNSGFEILAEATDETARILILKIKNDLSTFLLVNVYAPTQDDPPQQIKIIDFIEESLQGSDIILGGDFNLILDPSLDKKAQSPTSTLSNRYRVRVTALLQELHLCDVWRLMNKNARRYTFRRGIYASCLDYIFMSEHLYNTDTKTSILPCSLSDHDIITLEIGPSTPRLGPGQRPRTTTCYSMMSTLISRKILSKRLTLMITIWTQMPPGSG